MVYDPIEMARQGKYLQRLMRHAVTEHLHDRALWRVHRMISKMENVWKAIVHITVVFLTFSLLEIE